MMKTRAWTVLWLVGALTAMPSGAAAETAVETVARFYTALQNKRCAEAVPLRTGYTEKKCKAISAVEVSHMTPLAQRDNLAVVRLSVAFQQDRKPVQFSGFLTLVQEGGQWRIEGKSYASQGDDATGDRYLAASPHEQLRKAALPPLPTAPGVADHDPRPPSQASTEPKPAPAPQPELLLEPDAPPPPPRPAVGSGVAADPAAIEVPVIADHRSDQGPKPSPTKVEAENESAVCADSTGCGRVPAERLVEPPPIAPAPRGLGRGAPPATRPTAATAAAAPRPGANSILDACWDAQAQRGHPGERTIRDHLPADHSPPLRLRPRYPNNPLSLDYARSLRSVVPAGREKLVALTFDLCEQANETTGYDGELVDTLRAAGVPATFYAGGKWMRSHPERAMQLMADPLFEIGNHAWTHGNLRVLRGQEMEDQIQWTQAQYELLREELLALPCARTLAATEDARIPALPATFRFPYGTCNTGSLRTLAQAGLYPVQWNIVSADPGKGQTAQRIIAEVVAKMKPGSIVIAHGNGRGWHTAEALKTLIPRLIALGYRFVTVSDLLRAGTPVMTAECYEVRPGDNLRYDKLFGKGTE